MNVIINADDFGIDINTSRVIVDFIHEGICDTTTVMINMDGSDETRALALNGGIMDRVGLHLNLTQGKPLTHGIANDPVFCCGGNFGCYKRHRLHRFVLSKRSKQVVFDELRAQIENYLSLNYSGMTMDSHQGIHMDWQIYPLVMNLFQEYCFQRLRRSPNIGVNMSRRIFHIPFDMALRRAEGISTTQYMGKLNAYRATSLSCGSVELMTHPALHDGLLYIDWYNNMLLSDYAQTLADINHAPSTYELR